MYKMKITVGISNRHVHLDKDTYSYLFDNDELEVRNYLNQVGEFASTETVNLEYKGKRIEHVRIVGPFRNRNQIELLESDLTYLGLDAPTRRSGMLENTPEIIIENAGKKVLTDGVIRAEKHIHVPTNRQEELGLYERDVIKVIAPNKEFTAQVKVSDNGYFELHIDKDEGFEYGLKSGDEVELQKP